MKRSGDEKLALAQYLVKMAQLKVPKYFVDEDVFLRLAKEEKEIKKLIELVYGEKAKKDVEKWIKEPSSQKPLCFVEGEWKTCSYMNFSRLLDEVAKEIRPKLEKLKKSKKVGDIERTIIDRILEKEHFGSGEISRILKVKGKMERKISIIHVLVPLYLLYAIKKGKIKEGGELKEFLERYLQMAKEKFYFPEIIEKAILES